MGIGFASHSHWPLAVVLSVDFSIRFRSCKLIIQSLYVRAMGRWTALSHTTLLHTNWKMKIFSEKKHSAIPD